jgi:hypothetical protein
MKVFCSWDNEGLYSKQNKTIHFVHFKNRVPDNKFLAAIENQG